MDILYELNGMSLFLNPETIPDTKRLTRDAYIQEFQRFSTLKNGALEVILFRDGYRCIIIRLVDNSRKTYAVYWSPRTRFVFRVNYYLGLHQISLELVWKDQIDEWIRGLEEQQLDHWYIRYCVYLPYPLIFDVLQDFRQVNDESSEGITYAE